MIHKIVSGMVILVTTVAMAIVVYFTYLVIMPMEHWVDYKSVEPTKDVFCAHEPLVFESRFSTYRSVDMKFNDILYCSATKDDKNFVYTSSYDSRHTKVSEKAEGITRWRYNQLVPIPSYCYLQSNISIELPWGIKKSKTINGRGFCTVKQCTEGEIK